MPENVFDLLRSGRYPESREQFDEFRKAADKAFILRQRFNTCWNLKIMNRIIKKILGCPLKEDTLVVPPLHFDLGFNIHLGSHVIVNYDCSLLDTADITIGDGTVIGPGCKIVTAVHPLDPEKRAESPHNVTGAPISIGENVWIGAGAVILPGTTVGRDSVIGAGSVVTHDVEPRTVVAGNPAKVIRRL